jgi:aspartate aminotransferase-like enzyme
MSSPAQKIELSEYINRLRKRGHVPLGILYLNVEEERFRIAVLDDASAEEVNALLEKIGMALSDLEQAH